MSTVYRTFRPNCWTVRGGLIDPQSSILSAPLKFLVQATNSCKSLTGVEEFTNSINPEEVSCEIGVKSFTGWYGSFEFSMTVC